MRTVTGETDTLNWILSDHLGSSSVTANADGTRSRTIQYTVFGEVHASCGLTDTKYRYTGQLAQNVLGLDYYVARWMDPLTGHFISTDTILPDPSKSSSFDRYGYTYNNPVNFIDSTGHDSDCSPWDQDCRNQVEYEKREAGRPKLLTTLTESADVTSAVISTAVQFTANFGGGIIILIGCVGGEGLGCPVGLDAALKFDIIVTAGNPLALIENALGIVSLGSTAASDLLVGATRIEKDKLYIGKDTIVSFRNSSVGFIPEAIIDGFASQSQLLYDIKRKNGIDKGDSILISNSNYRTIFSAIFWEKDLTNPLFDRNKNTIR